MYRYTQAVPVLTQAVINFSQLVLGSKYLIPGQCQEIILSAGWGLGLPSIATTLVIIKNHLLGGPIFEKFPQGLLHWISLAVLAPVQRPETNCSTNIYCETPHENSAILTGFMSMNPFSDSTTVHRPLEPFLLPTNITGRRLNASI